MKQCPTCNRTYADGTLVYCLADGQLLSAPYDPPATQILPPVQDPTTSPQSEWPHDQSVALLKKRKSTRMIAVGVILVLIIGAVLMILWVQKPHKNAPAANETNATSNPGESSQPEKPEVITRSELKRSLGEANERVIAAGYVLSDINADSIRGLMEKSPAFSATIVFVDPLGPKNLVCQRQRDEEGDNSNYGNYVEIINKIRDFRSPAKTGGWIGNRLKVGVIDLYPTLAVILVDNDLYAYFLPYGTAADSPVLKFKNYARNPHSFGRFFDDHLNKITGYRSPVVGSETKFLLADDDWQRYGRADLNPTHRCR